MKTPTSTDADTKSIQLLKSEYSEAINKELLNCNDIILLDFIFKLIVSRNKKR